LKFEFNDFSCIDKELQYQGIHTLVSNQGVC
jgi:hypothetical protein